jgi:hypothetical protein
LFKANQPTVAGCAVWGVGVRLIACWNCGVESCQEHGSLSEVSVVSYQVEVSALGWPFVQRRITESCVPEYDCEASIMKGPGPTMAFCAMYIIQDWRCQTMGIPVQNTCILTQFSRWPGSNSTISWWHGIYGTKTKRRIWKMGTYNELKK